MFSLYITLKWTNSLKRVNHKSVQGQTLLPQSQGIQVCVVKLECDEDNWWHNKDIATHTENKGMMKVGLKKIPTFLEGTQDCQKENTNHLKAGEPKITNHLVITQPLRKCARCCFLP